MAVQLLSQCRRFLLSSDEAKALVDEMTGVVVREWHTTVWACSVSEADCEMIRRTYVYAGLSLGVQLSGEARQ